MNGVVLEAAAEDLDRPVEDILPADQGIHLAGLRPGGQLRRVVPEELVLFLLGLPDRFSLPFARVPGDAAPAVSPVRTETPWEM